MRAFVHKIDEKTGRDILGTSDAWVTPEYKNLQNLNRYFMRNLPPGQYHVEAYRNFDNRYGKPDYDYHFTHWVQGGADWKWEPNFTENHRARREAA